MAWTLCTSGSAIVKAGSGASSVIIASGAALEPWSNEAENLICSIAKYDVITNFANLTANGKQIMQELSASLVAEQIAGYDAKGYLMSGEQITILNRLENSINRLLPLIREDKIKTYLQVT